LASSKPDLIVLTECFYCAGVPGRYDELAISVDNEVVKAVAAAAKRLAANIVCPVFEKRGDLVFNTALWINRQGDVAGRYDKIHPTESEIDLGDSQIYGGNLGIEITAGSADNVIANGVVRDNSADGIRLDGQADDNLIQNVAVTGNGQNGIAILEGGGNRISGCSVIGNNTAGSGHGGVALLAGPAAVELSHIEDNLCAGIYADEAAGLTLHTNLIAGNQHGIQLSFSTDVAVESNTIVENGSGLFIEGGSAPAVAYNIIWNSGGFDLSGLFSGFIIEDVPIIGDFIKGFKQSFDPETVKMLQDSFEMLTDAWLHPYARRTVCSSGPDSASTRRRRWRATSTRSA